MTSFFKGIFSFPIPDKKENFLKGVFYKTLLNGRELKVNYSSLFGYEPADNILLGDQFLSGDKYFHSQDQNADSWIEVIMTKEWVIPNAIVIADSGNIYRLRNWNVTASQDGIDYDVIDSQTDFTKFLFFVELEMIQFDIEFEI